MCAQTASSQKRVRILDYSMFARQPSIVSGPVRFQGELSSATALHYDQQEHFEVQQFNTVPVDLESVPVSANECKRDELREDIRLRGDPEDEVSFLCVLLIIFPKWSSSRMTVVANGTTLVIAFSAANGARFLIWTMKNTALSVIEASQLTEKRLKASNLSLWKTIATLKSTARRFWSLDPWTLTANSRKH